MAARAIEFTMNGRKHRIVGRSYGHQYAPLAEYRKENVLQRKRWYGWRDVEVEEVPSWAWIQSATLGSTEWKSKLIERYRQWIEATA